MDIYVTHSRSFDYKNGLYLPIRRSQLNEQHKFILPHEFSEEPYDSRSLILGNSLGLVVAEVSVKSTAQGCEIGWADAKEISVAFFYKPGSNPSNALKKVSDFFVEYDDEPSLLVGLERAIKFAS
jgi:hypothetical protein